MTDQLYGFRESDVRAIGAVVNKDRQRLPDAGRRTRRVYPAGSRLTPYLMNETNAYWSTGIGQSVESQAAEAEEGGEATTPVYTARRVTDISTDGATLTLSDAEVEIDFQAFVGVHTPDGLDSANSIIWCMKSFGKIRAIGHGQTYWGDATITTAVSGTSSSGAARLYSSGPIVDVVSSESIAVNTGVDVMFDHVAQLFRVVVIDCEAVPEVA